jgi:drug/metabolite transporter (DMT)-like permease
LTTAAQQRRAYVAWVVICLVWGTTYLAIKVALDTIPPFLMGGIRYLTAGALLAGFVVATGRRLPDRTGWRHALVCGALLLGIGNGGVVWAEKWVATGLAAVIVAATPFWMVSIEAAFGGERLTRRAAVGLALGFGGIVWLVWPTLQGSLADARGAGLGFVVGVASLQAASAGWAVGSSYSRRHATRGDAFGAAAAQMICGGLVMLVAGSLTGEWQVISLTPPTLAALVYLTVAGSLVGFVCYHLRPAPSADVVRVAVHVRESDCRGDAGRARAGREGRMAGAIRHRDHPRGHGHRLVAAVDADTACGARHELRPRPLRPRVCR